MEYKHKNIIFLASYFIFYLLFLISFHIEGLESGVKYNVQFWICELILFVYFYVFFIESRIRTLKMKSIARFCFMVFLILVSIFSLLPQFDYQDKDDDNLYDYVHQILEVKLDSKCQIIKLNSFAPFYDKIQGLAYRSLTFSSADDLYYSLSKKNKENPCFYFLDIHMMGEVSNYWDIKWDNMEYHSYRDIDPAKIDLIFSECGKELVSIIGSKTDSSEFTNGPEKDVIFRYDC